MKERLSYRLDGMVFGFAGFPKVNTSLAALAMVVLLLIGKLWSGFRYR